jgi:CheY-like chemotaxis protein
MNRQMKHEMNGQMTRHPYILVVEDDPDLRQNLTDILRAEGYVTGAAANGREALAILQTSERPSLIVLDLAMPDMNGWQFRDKQRADLRLIDIPVLVVTANRNLGPNVPGNEVLVKPFGLDEVLEKVKRLSRAQADDRS